jgi:hypothetical protein
MQRTEYLPRGERRPSVHLELPQPNYDKRIDKGLKGNIKTFFGLLTFCGLCLPSGTLQSTMFWKPDLFLSSGNSLGDTYPVGSISKS